MSAHFTPVRLHLKKDEKLDIEWQDGHACTFTLTFLRSHCPCASCKALREEQAKRKSRLNILPGNYSGSLVAVAAERVGNYAIRIEWSDNHGSGIYSFQYLREICPCGKP
jgi:DUF971 family protein